MKYWLSSVLNFVYTFVVQWAKLDKQHIAIKQRTLYKKGKKCYMHIFIFVLILTGDDVVIMF